MLTNEIAALAVEGMRAKLGKRWGRVPDFVASTAPAQAVCASVELTPLHAPHVVAAIAKARRAARVYVHQQNAIDAPFRDIERAKAGLQKTDDVTAHASVASRRRLGGGLGLVSNATKGMLPDVKEDRPVRGMVRINRDAQRIKRMKTSVGHAARLLHFDAHTERHAGLWNKKFITLTYRAGEEWESGHFGAFRRAMAEWCKRRRVRLRFVWVAELQTRGAIHYHVVVWLPKGKFLPHADTQGWWPHGSTNIVTAQSPIGYITKYASKTTAEQAAQYPKGARMCGHGGLEAEGRRAVRYWQSPIWVRDVLTGRADIRKVVGGYMDKFTGEFLPSPWRVYVGPGGEVWAYRIDQQEQEKAA
jgi:hypothetical protein